jgi:hypothetical protein
MSEILYLITEMGTRVNGKATEECKYNLKVRGFNS